MIGVLIAAGLIFYGVLYSGVRTLKGDPIGTLDALLGKEPAPTPGSAGTTSVASATTGARPTDPNRRLGSRLASTFGFTGSEFSALDALWTRESGWRTEAVNPSSGAAGIPQRLPAAHPGITARWMSSARAQILWGLDYIRNRYGSPSAALAHSDRFGWY